MTALPSLHRAPRGKQLLGLLAGLFALVLTTTPTLGQDHLWSRGVGGAEFDAGNDVAVDGSNNVIIVGTFRLTADFGGGPLTSAGSSDFFIVKYDPNGNHLWSKQIGDANFAGANDVGLDASGNIFVTGSFAGTTDFGGITLITAGFNDIFVAKYDPNGNLLWVRGFGSPGFEFGNSIAVDGTGNVFVTGTFRGSVDFGGGLLASAGGDDIFVAKYDPNGNHLWSKRFGNTQFDVGNAIAAAGTGDVYVTGYFEGPVDFGGGLLTPLGIRDMFVVKFNLNGIHQWSQQFGDNGSEFPQGIIADNIGNVVVTGSFDSSIDFGGGPLTGAFDVFLAKLNPDGSHQWSQRFGDTDGDSGADVQLDNSGNVLLTGHFGGTVNFGGGPLTSAGGIDAFFAKFAAADGRHRLSMRLGGPPDTQGTGVSFDGAGNILVTGLFRGTVDFGGGALLSSAGNADIFVAKYATTPPLPAQFNSILDVTNDQGGSVRINFARATRDSLGSPELILQYEVFRRIDPLPSSSAVAAAARAKDLQPEIMLAGSEMLSQPDILQDGWDFIGIVPAHGASNYNFVAPTLADSTVVSGQHWSVFFIRAATADPFTFFDSAPDSGYSLDNLAPAAPANVAVMTFTFLTWDGVSTPDFNYYNVYGSSSATLDVTAVLIAQTTGTSLDVQTTPHPIYHVTAVDFSGNEGDAGNSSNTAVGIRDIPLLGGLALRAHPNPFNPSTTITYTLPAAGRVSVSVYDIGGHLVERLIDNEYREPNQHRIEYQPSSATGIYFVRLESVGQIRTLKIVLLK